MKVISSSPPIPFRERIFEPVFLTFSCLLGKYFGLKCKIYLDDVLYKLQSPTTLMLKRILLHKYMKFYLEVNYYFNKMLMDISQLIMTLSPLLTCNIEKNFGLKECM